MEQAGLPTVILPEVRDELTRVPRSAPVPPAVVQSWWHVRNLPDAPFAWVELDDDQKMVAVDVLNSFTAACFPRTPVDRIAALPDANIVAEAVAIGAEALVTGDINTIDHYEINGVLSKAFGRNREFVTTLDSALCRAHPCAEAAESLLTLALSTVAPVQSEGWGVDDAHEDLKRLQKALVGSNLTENQPSPGDPLGTQPRFGTGAMRSAAHGQIVACVAGRTATGAMASRRISSDHRPWNFALTVAAASRPPCSLVRQLAKRPSRRVQVAVRVEAAAEGS